MGNNDYETRDNAVFGISDSGWSNDKHGFQWLSIHFEPQTKTPHHHQLLIIDRHLSHLSVKFLEFCLNYNIHLLSLPLHSTHILQPLDVGLFSPLKEYYTKLLDQGTRTHPYQSLNKSDFFPLLMQARRQAFTEKNIKSAFTATGIHAFRRQQGLNILPHFSTLGKPQLKSAKSTSSPTIRCLQSIAAQSSSLQEMKQTFGQLVATTDTAVAEKEIAIAEKEIAIAERKIVIAEKAIAEETVH